MVKAMNKAGGQRVRIHTVKAVNGPPGHDDPYQRGMRHGHDQAMEGEAAELLRLRGLEGELRRMLPLLELNRSTTGVAKRLKLLLGDA